MLTTCRNKLQVFGECKMNIAVCLRINMRNYAWNMCIVAVATTIAACRPRYPYVDTTQKHLNTVRARSFFVHSETIAATTVFRPIYAEMEFRVQRKRDIKLIIIEHECLSPCAPWNSMWICRSSRSLISFFPSFPQFLSDDNDNNNTIVNERVRDGYPSVIAIVVTSAVYRIDICLV